LDRTLDFVADYPRHAEHRIRTALADTRVVAITGPRQSGKTTLARRFARNGRTYVTLDDRGTLDAARGDPVAFIRGLDRAVIDEVQRAPEILLAIKRRVDEDRRPGRYLLTGSANLATIATVHDSLAGRMETIPLLPLSRSELLRRKRTVFIESVFKGEIPQPAEILKGDALIRIAASGGYPEALTRRTEARRQDWYRAYIQSIIDRDVPEVASVMRPGMIPKLMQIAAQFAGQLVNLSEIGRSGAMDHKTADTYLQLLEQLFIVRRVQPWFRNELSRLIKTPKLHFVDSGLLCAMRGYTASRLKSDRTALGPILEGMMFSELLKAIACSGQQIAMYHYRDKSQLEVDFVLENGAGQVVGVEVKAAASVTRRDFAGLERLAAASGAHFVQGVILHDGDQILNFADHLRAAPLACLWA